MKRIIFLAAILFSFLGASAQLEYVQGSFKRVNADAEAAGADLGHRNMAVDLVKKWPMDADGNKEAALVRVIFRNVPDDLILNKMTPSISGGRHVVNTEYRKTDKGQEMWVFFDSTNGRRADLTFRQDGNLGSAIVRDVVLEPHQMYTLEVNNRMRLTINVITNPEGLDVTVGGVHYGLSPVTIPEMTTGTQTLMITNPRGLDVDLAAAPTTIRVDENHTNFNFDLRKVYKIKFNTDESNGTLFLDGKEIGPVPATYDLPAGTYNLRAAGNNGVILEYPVRLGAEMTEVDLRFVPSLNMNFGAEYDGRQVASGAQLTIRNSDGTTIPNGVLNFFDLPMTRVMPYGKYKLAFSYRGPGGLVSKNENLTVDNNTPPTFISVLPIKSVHHNVFKRDFPRRSWGINVAYVMRSYSAKIGGKSYTRDWWGQDGHENGIQFGLAYQPYFGAGLGLNTGLYAEYFWTTNEDESAKVEEWDLYAPLHLMFRLPIKDYDFHISTGLGFEYGLSLKGKDLTADDGGWENIDFDDETPKAFNMYYEISAGVRLRALQLNFTYGLGLTKNKNFIPEAEDVKARRIAVSAALMF